MSPPRPIVTTSTPPADMSPDELLTLARLGRSLGPDLQAQLLAQLVDLTEVHRAELAEYRTAAHLVVYASAPARRRRGVDNLRALLAR
jgi:hypothetical protein